MAARFIYALAPAVARTALPDILIAFFYFFLLAAADSRPHVESDARRVSVSGELARYGGSFIIVGLLVYFVLLPAHYASPESRTWLPSLSFVVAMDFILLLRFGSLWKSCRLFRWRAAYGLIIATVTLWIITDILELLNQAEGWAWEWRGISGMVWLLPFFPLMLSARVRHFSFPAEDLPPAGYPGFAPVETLVRSRNYLVVYAVAFPVVHFGLYALHVLNPALRDARELVVLSSVLALGGLALVDRFLLEKESHTILAESGKAEEALRSSEARYRALVENSQGLICTHNMEGRLLSVNPASAHLLGYEPEDMLGHNVSEFLAPWSLSREEDYYGYLERDREDTGLLKVKTRDGKEQVWVYRSTLVEEPGKEPYVLGHAQDITERIRAEDALRESEAHNRALLGAIPDMMFVIRRDGTFLDFKSSREVEPARPPARGISRKESDGNAPPGAGRPDIELHQPGAKDERGNSL